MFACHRFAVVDLEIIESLVLFPVMLSVTEESLVVFVGASPCPMIAIQSSAGPQLDFLILVAHQARGSHVCLKLERENVDDIFKVTAFIGRCPEREITRAGLGQKVKLGESFLVSQSCQIRQPASKELVPFSLPIAHDLERVCNGCQFAC